MKALLLALLLTASYSGLSGQDLVGGFPPPAKTKNLVVYASEAQTVAAGKKSAVQLQFQVVEGYHVNSHRPKSDLLIRTELKLEPTAGVTVGEVVYPAGSAYRLADDTLDVYTGAFAVTVPVLAAAGEHTITGVLRYQACDKAACYPVKTLPVEMLIRAK